MKIESRFIAATLMAATAFVATGGVRAAEQAVAAEEARLAGKETSIPFANMGGIRDWRAIDDSSIYVQDIQRNWYIARLSVPNPDLTFVTAIGFETKGTNQLDRFASLVVGGQRVQLSSFVASAPPPPKAKAAATK